MRNGCSDLLKSLQKMHLNTMRKAKQSLYNSDHLESQYVYYNKAYSCKQPNSLVISLGV